jgi:hypothetical protein
VRVWLADLEFHLATALRAVGIGLVAVVWASALASEAQQLTDTRAYVEVAMVVATLLVVHWLTPMPPSWSAASLLEPLQRDMLAVARERAPGDPSRQADYVAAMRRLAEARIRGGANLPRDRRAWLRALSDLADTDQARN